MLWTEWSSDGFVFIIHLFLARLVSIYYYCHLLIMEELGGDDLWFDRFVAQHIALGYFWMALVFYLIKPVYVQCLLLVNQHRQMATLN